MRIQSIRLALLLSGALALPAGAGIVPFTGTLEITASVGTAPAGFQLLSVPVSGAADVTGSVVRIAAGAFSAPVPSLSGFGGTLMNGAATFSVGGAGAGSSCPLTSLQEVCIDGGGFGGAMPLAGVTHLGQSLVVWGLSGANTGMTASGMARVERARLWTEGRATAWFYILEIDPTPFTLMASGTFRGLPATATGDAGFSLVTPMVVTSVDVGSTSNLRAVARLRIDLAPRPVPLGGVALLAGALALAGGLRLRLRR